MKGLLGSIICFEKIEILPCFLVRRRIMKKITAFALVSLLLMVGLLSYSLYAQSSQSSANQEITSSSDIASSDSEITASDGTFTLGATDYLSTFSFTTIFAV